MTPEKNVFSVGYQSLLFLAALSVLSTAPMTRAAVPAADITLQAPATDNLPVITVISAYSANETLASGAGTGGPGTHAQKPLYAPYDNRADAWWDNLISEQIQARLPVVMLTTCGSYTTNPTDTTGGGDMNPLRLAGYINALHRAGASNTIKLGCFVEGDAESIYRQYYGLPAGALCDFSNQDSWNQVWWLRIVKPWFDTIPASYWYKINGKVPIEFWGLNINSLYSNQQGNVSQMFNFLAQKMYDTYGVYPCIFMGSVNCDTTLASCPYFLGDNEWFSPPATPYTMTPYKGATWGGLVAGYINPNYYVSGTTAYQNTNTLLLRNDPDGSGELGDTLKSGLTAAVDGNAIFSVIEGYTDISESCGLYRSFDANWLYPNQYLDIISSYTDLRTVTNRLLAAGCDANNATTGNTGGAFIRSGSPTSLSVRALTGAPAATASSANGSTVQLAPSAFDGNLTTAWYTATTAPAWLQYDYGTGNLETVSGYYVTSSTLAQGDDPAAWTLQGSNNGTSWTTLDAQSSQAFAARNQANYYAIAHPGAYQIYRLSITANHGGSTFGVAVAELKLAISSSTGGGWAVTDTQAGEYLQWNDINFSAGNYKFPLCYSGTANHTAKLSIDGVAQSSVTLPSTGSMNTFSTVYLATAPVHAGLHTLRVTLVDGGPDIQWLFIKKYDPLMTFLNTSSACYLTSELGGNDTLVSNRTTAASWENFSIDDLTGAGTVSSGDTVNIQVKDGLYITPENGGGGTVSVNRRVPAGWEGLKLVKVVGSGAIAAGNQVAIECSDGLHYLTVKSDGTVDASGTSIGAAQTFVVGINAQ
jgi:hypothetical protein